MRAFFIALIIFSHHSSRENLLEESQKWVFSLMCSLIASTRVTTFMGEWSQVGLAYLRISSLLLCHPVFILQALALSHEPQWIHVYRGDSTVGNSPIILAPMKAVLAVWWYARKELCSICIEIYIAIVRVLHFLVAGRKLLFTNLWRVFLRY